MIKRYIKLTFIASIIGLALSYGVSEFLSKKINNEAKSYNENLEQYSFLQDNMSLCVGLYESNPSIELKNECESILTQLYKTRASLLNNYPYTSFYSKYFNN